ncbi:MAG TPA: ABC transporter permease [Chthoniobacterales bacterium]
MSFREQTVPAFAGNFPASVVIDQPVLLDGPSAKPGFDWRALRPGLVLAGLFVALLFVAAVEPRWLVSGDPLEANARHAFRGPSYGHPLGTDENGRDVLTRLVYGVRPSLIMGLAATAIGVGLGTALGLIAGLGPRIVDNFFMRVVDVLLAFPDLLLALVIITFWGQGLVNAIFAVGVASVPRYARMVRAQTFVVRNTAYVEAATTLGLRRSTLIWRHVLPNAIKPILILATIGIGGKIAAGASLSFLGFGAPPPAPEWGSMLSVGRNFLSNAWWLTAIPGIAITLTVVSVTALGRELLRRSEGKTV